VFAAPFVILRPGEVVDDLVLSFTTTPTELQGRAVDAAGLPADRHTIVVFPVDPALWIRSDLLIKEVRVSEDGRYTLKGLLPGKYYVGSRLIGQAGQSPSHDQLSEMAQFAVQVELQTGRLITLDVRVR
jgi:hypothetical protein